MITFTKIIVFLEILLYFWALLIKESILLIYNQQMQFKSEQFDEGRWVFTVLVTGDEIRTKLNNCLMIISERYNEDGEPRLLIDLPEVINDFDLPREQLQKSFSLYLKKISDELEEHMDVLENLNNDNIKRFVNKPQCIRWCNVMEWFPFRRRVLLIQRMKNQAILQTNMSKLKESVRFSRQQIQLMRNGIQNNITIENHSLPRWKNLLFDLRTLIGSFNLR